ACFTISCVFCPSLPQRKSLSHPRLYLKFQHRTSNAEHPTSNLKKGTRSSIVSNLTEANSGSLREPVEHLANICFARRRESAREILARATDVLPHLRLRILRNERLPPIEKSLRPEQRNKSFTVPPYQ